MSERTDSALLGRLVFGAMLMLAADIAFTRQNNAIIDAKLDKLNTRAERVSSEVSELTTEILLLSDLKQTQSLYFDERLDAIELFLARLDEDFAKNKSKRRLVNEARIKEILEELKR